MDYEKKYKEALERARQSLTYPDMPGFMRVDVIFPELAESEDEKIRKELIDFVKSRGGFKGDWIAWLEKQVADPNKEYWRGYREGKQEVIDKYAELEKQGKCETDCHRNHQDANYPNGCIVLEDFNGGEGFYKLNLDYLNKKQVEEVEEMVRTWNKESKTSNENIKSCIGMCLTDANEQRFKDYNTTLKDCLDWFKKQGEQKFPSLSEKDIVCLKRILDFLRGEHNSYTGKDFTNEIVVLEWLIAHPALIHSSELQQVQNEQKPAWSEEDEKILKDIITDVKFEGYNNDMQANSYKKINWLESLKNRCLPQ